MNNKVDDARKSIGHMLRTLMVYQQPKIERKIIEGDRGEPIKYPSMIKSVSLGLKNDEWMNNSAFLSLVSLGPFYREFGVGLHVTNIV